MEEKMKHLLKFAITGMAVLGLVASASATTNTYTVNMCGASAQAGFWQKAGEAVVKSALSCSAAVLDSTSDGKKLIVKATGCKVDSDETGDDIVYVRYTASSSSTGCKKFDCETEAFADPLTCDFGDNIQGECSGTVDASCMLGCADVACETITATTSGYYTGRSGSATEAWEDFGDSAGYAYAPGYSKTYKGVTVPFGFIANNSVTDAVCNYPTLPTNSHLAYDKRGWECDPTEVNALSCRGDYKCLDTDGDEVGVCLDGNQVAASGDEVDTVIDAGERQCTTAADCKMTEAVTCVEEPLKNISRLMALHIFAHKVGTWRDFGPSFVDLPIVKCMRHGGSGTHQTLINTVFRGDALVKNTTVYNPSRYEKGQYVWHYKSSSDLTRDCVAYYAGGIGYVDADKAMDTSKIKKTQSREGAYNNTVGKEETDFVMQDGIHQLMYQGVAPSRNDVANGKYNFWAAQQCFVDTSLNCHSTESADILDLIMTEAGDPTYLTFDQFGQRAYFWATQDEMKVEKTNEYAYPSRK
jgi:ABC-type phosphate transport system substrate-binding protein